jgi:hypothetical protein
MLTGVRSTIEWQLFAILLAMFEGCSRPGPARQYNGANPSDANSANSSADSFPGLESLSAAGQEPPDDIRNWSPESRL